MANPFFKKSDTRTKKIIEDKRRAAGVFNDPQAGYAGNPNNVANAIQNPEVPVNPKPTIPISERQRISKENPGKVIDEFGNIQSDAQQHQSRVDVERIKSGQMTFEQQQAQAAQQAQAEAAIQNLGLNEQQIAAIQAGIVQAPVDFGQALTAGAANILPSAIKGAGIGLGAGLAGGALAGAGAGAAAGSVVPVAGTAIGAGIGLLAGLTSGILSNIKSQQKGEIAATKDVLTNAKTNMRKLSALAAKDPSNAAIYVSAYNQQLAQVYQAQRKLKAETSGNLNKFMNDGTSDLSDFDLFLQPNGQADIYKQQLQMALLTGAPPALTVEDFEAP